ncbi:unnamed protein product [Ceratitis capitata]|uniref:(Mediterranean fruit fly) hypothetical protein n=1 Tax=Ceratitis capitata TaxID=7213 RepID=A0A811UZC8_CERCA|nr:unnamed protein product [Ceratitis capitata]
MHTRFTHPTSHPANEPTSQLAVQPSSRLPYRWHINGISGYNDSDTRQLITNTSTQIHKYQCKWKCKYKYKYELAMAKQRQTECKRVRGSCSEEEFKMRKAYLGQRQPTDLAQQQYGHQVSAATPAPQSCTIGGGGGGSGDGGNQLLAKGAH